MSESRNLCMVLYTYHDSPSDLFVLELDETLENFRIVLNSITFSDGVVRLYNHERTEDFPFESFEATSSLMYMRALLGESSSLHKKFRPVSELSLVWTLHMSPSDRRWLATRTRGTT